MSISDKKNSYYERLVPENIPWYHNQMLKDHIKRYEFALNFTKNKIVLDIACGTGYGSKMIAEKYAKKVFAIDISRETINYAKKYYNHKNISYIVGNATKIPIPDHTIDIVVSFETLEHIKNYKKFIREIHRVLKPKGALIISTPNKELGTEDVNPFHFKEFTLQELKELFKKQYKLISIYGQRPMHLRYIKLVSKFTNLLPVGKLRWLLDSGFKYIFRNMDVLIIKNSLQYLPSIYILLLEKN